MEKLNILLVSGVVTTEHNYRFMNEQLRKLLTATGRFNVRVTEEFNGCTDETLSNYDAILLNYDGKNTPTDPLYTRWSEKTEQAFFDYVASGKGVAIYHSSVWLSEELPEEYKKLWGIYLTTPSGGRRNPKDNFTMQVCEGEHPITAGFPAECSIVNDDLFTGSTRHPQAPVQVLAEVFDELDNYRVPFFPPPHHPVIMPDNKLENMPGVNTMQPVCWTNTYGNGRVFAISIGHEIETLRRVPYLTMLCRGVEWAATGKVTLNPPDRSGENRLKEWPYY